MSNLHNAMALENLYETVEEEDKKGLIDNLINQTAFETGLHADDDRDEILQKIAEALFELYDSAPDLLVPTLEELEARVCTCGELIEKCPDAYEHITQGI